MSFEIEILEEKENPLINRTELKFRVDHLGEGSPNRLEVRKKIAAMQGAKEQFTIIRKIESKFGKYYSMGNANVYDDIEDLKYFEPFHIKVRNLEPDKRSEIYKLKRKGEQYNHLFGY